MIRLIFLAPALALTLSAPAWPQSKVHKTVTNEKVEKVLHDLTLKFQKVEHKKSSGVVLSYDFQRGDQSHRLFNYTNDLWIECVFDKKIGLEQVNRWNAEAKFSRAVLLEQKDKTVVSLEAQLDCVGGVTDAMIKQFVTRFDEEAKKFAKSAK